MKKILALILSMTLVAGMLAGCGSGNENASESSSTEETTDTNEGESADGAETTWGIEPMSEPVTIDLAYFSGAMHALPWYIMESKGWLEELNISLNYNSFISGPVMMEASADWDIGTTGAPGAIPGSLGYDVRVLGFCDEEASLCLFVREDSPIAQAGQGNFEDYPEMYGTVDTWKGIECLLPLGTTVHQTLATVLEEIGLTTDDVTIVNMDVTTALTAFKAGEGDLLAVWTSSSIEAMREGFVMAACSRDNNVIVPTTICATDQALNDPVKHEAIVKMYELYYRTAEWMKENVEEGAQLYMETCTIEGVAGADDYDLCYESLNDWYFPFTLDEMIELMSTTGEDPAGLYQGELGNGYIELFNTFDFFMSQGSYTEDDRNFLIENNKVDSSIAKEVQEVIASR